MKRFLQIVFLICFGSAAVAQDPQFTQFYAASMYHNPAMTGGSFRDRVVVNYRNQWPSLPKSFVTYAASYDHYSRRYQSGFGLQAYTDKAGAGELRSTGVSGMYSYHLGLSNTWAVRAGLQFGYGFRDLNYNKLTFGDQIDLEQIRSGKGLYGYTIDDSQTKRHNVSYFDAGTGLLIYTKDFWFGVSGLHLNEPNQSLSEEVSKLPMRMNFNAGMKISLDNKERRAHNARQGVPEKSITPAILYKSQGKFDQLDMGLYIHYNPMVVGFWYRGLPIKNYREGVYNHDAIALLVGYKLADVSFGYSYDLTVSRLGSGTGGAHEISLTYEFDSKASNKKKKPKLIPCPKF